MTVQTREVSGFSAVELRGVGTLRIEMGETEALTIEADDEVLASIVTEVVGHKLIIRFDAWQAFMGWARNNQVTMHLVAREMASVALTGAGTIEASIPSDSLEFAIAGAGSVRAGVRARDLTVNVSGTGDVTLAGSTERQEIRITGAGTYDGLQMTSKDAFVFIGGAGRAKLDASDRLDVQIGGAGSVQYAGDPRVEQKIGGFGKVERVPGPRSTPTPPPAG